MDTPSSMAGMAISSRYGVHYPNLSLRFRDIIVAERSEDNRSCTCHLCCCFCEYS
jgi:hypothetical protein